MINHYENYNLFYRSHDYKHLLIFYLINLSLLCINHTTNIKRNVLNSFLDLCKDYCCNLNYIVLQFINIIY